MNRLHSRPSSNGRRILRRLAFAALIASASASAPTHAEPAPHSEIRSDDNQEACGLELRLPPSVYYRGARSRGYDVFHPSAHQEHFPVIVRHQGGACDYVIVAGSRNDPAASALINGANRLNYEVSVLGRGRNILSADFEGSADNQISGRFQNGERVDVADLFMEIPAGQFARPGRYSDNLEIKLFRNIDGVLKIVEQRTLVVTVDVPAEVRASIGANLDQQIDSTSVDLGELTSGLRHALAFTVETNTDLDVTFTSLNDGNLKHKKASYAIGYQLIMAGQRARANGHDRIPILVRPGQPMSQQSFEIELGDVSANALAGEYADQLTVTITTR